MEGRRVVGGGRESVRWRVREGDNGELFEGRGGRGEGGERGSGGDRVGSVAR